MKIPTTIIASSEHSRVEDDDVSVFTCGSDAADILSDQNTMLDASIVSLDPMDDLNTSSHSRWESSVTPISTTMGLSAGTGSPPSKRALKQRKAAPQRNFNLSCSSLLSNKSGTLSSQGLSKLKRSATAATLTPKSRRSSITTPPTKPQRNDSLKRGSSVPALMADESESTRFSSNRLSDMSASDRFSSIDLSDRFRSRRRGMEQMNRLSIRNMKNASWAVPPSA